MLKNRELHRVIDIQIRSDKEEAKIKEEKETESRKQLIDYLVTRKNEGNLNSTDKLLFKYMEKSLKNDIYEIVNIE